MKIYEVSYKANGVILHAYFKSDSPTNFSAVHFYMYYPDCVEQNAKYVNILEETKIKEALLEHKMQ